MTRPESLAIASEAAGRTGIICSGGGTLPPKEFLQRLWEQMNTGNCRGAATGRNIHQKDTESAVKMTAACHAIICEGASVDEASKSTSLKFGVDLVGVIHPDITKAQRRYCHQIITKKIIHHKLMQKFASSWNFIGLESTLNEGDVVPVVVGDIPMLMTMKDNEINCVSNVCTHRGMILCDDNQKRFNNNLPVSWQDFFSLW